VCSSDLLVTVRFGYWFNLVIFMSELNKLPTGIGDQSPRPKISVISKAASETGSLSTYTAMVLGFDYL